MTTADGHLHPLLVMNGVCTAVDYPGSTASYANSINPRGDIAGRYTASGHTHGFVVWRFVQAPSCAVVSTPQPENLWQYLAEAGKLRLINIIGAAFLFWKVAKTGVSSQTARSPHRAQAREAVTAWSNTNRSLQQFLFLLNHQVRLGVGERRFRAVPPRR